MLASHPYYSTIHISICNSGIDSGSVSKSIGLQSFESHSLITQPPRCDVVLVLVALSVLCVSGVDVVHEANAPAPSRKLPMSPYPTSIPPAKTPESTSPAKSLEPASPGESPASPPADFESIVEMFSRFLVIVNGLEALGKTYTEVEKVMKILRSLPKKWETKVTAIQEAKDLNKLSLEELIGSLMTYEIEL
ncbi:hypothetical protein VitviT2T_017926 [Vitis vinifera]|uniref:Uncharacterized protein n=1 Tax=Vitis vinifera TaxID=29760 RepID=A0ABY9CVZ5_VITVI|nr:hypothetical protein VitviT2T_017926 [Vitis vinifera]